MTQLTLASAGYT